MYKTEELNVSMKRLIRWRLVAYDLLFYLSAAFFVLVIYPSSIDKLEPGILAGHILLGYATTFVLRILFKVYEQIWRYAGSKEYIKLVAADAIACVAFLVLKRVFPHTITFVRAVSLFTLNLLACMTARHVYQWIYQNRASDNAAVKATLGVLKYIGGISFTEEKATVSKIKIAIIGAGSIGTTLADELIQNPKATYLPVCFVDIDKGKVGREIYGIPVLSGTENLQNRLKAIDVQEVIFALPNLSAERRAELYEIYNGYGYKIKAYDYTALSVNEVNAKRQIRDFDIEDLLFRSATHFLEDKTMAWYSGKNVLITGGGGSIGSELARQIAKCHPARLVILDVYENGAYDIQQELKLRYGDALNLRVEIASICDAEQIDKIFREHTPDIVLHAAAHKHVPLMERNVCEAVQNNIFGTLNVVEACERYGVSRFIMISTDKAVNPTNVMGATKRMCEMIVQSRTSGKTSFSATRFGNVLGSNGSVIPLFKRQIANGGPVTITDKRIVRYFMTIPEAAQLVLTSGAMADNGELYVLDMGNPVRILDLAENMIRLSGLEPYKDIDIVETGLRPGEKLYEELLIKSEELDKTSNDMIYVERDKPEAPEKVDKKIKALKEALATKSNRVVKEALLKAIPTYHLPEEVNPLASESEEMKAVSAH